MDRLRKEGDVAGEIGIMTPYVFQWFHTCRSLVLRKLVALKGDVMSNIIAAFITGTANILSSLITFAYKRKSKRRMTNQRSMPDLQIKNIFRIPEENDLREERMQEILLEETSSLRLLARSGFSYLHSQGLNWRNMTKQESEEGGICWLLEQGVPMTVILENPYCENGKCRLRADGNSKPWRDLSWERIQEIKNKYDNLEVCFTAVPILCSLFLTDSSAFYDPYHLGRLPTAEASKNHFLVFEFSKPKRPVRHNYYEQLWCHFEFVREDELTLSFKQFEQKYGDRLK